MNRPSHTPSPTPSFRGGGRGYLASNQRSYNTSDASMQSMATPDSEPFGALSEDYAFEDSQFASSLTHGLTNSYPQQPSSTAFPGFNSVRQNSEYVLPQNSGPYSTNTLSSSLTPSSEPTPFYVSQMSSPKFYSPGDYNGPNNTEMANNPVNWRHEMSGPSIPSHLTVSPMMQPGDPSHAYDMGDTLDTEEWLSSMPSAGSTFTGVDSGLNYDSEGLLGSNSANDESSRATPSQEKRPRIVTTREDGNYECTVEGCGKLFNRSYNYRAHLETHDSERIHPFICELPGCLKRFRRKTDLQRHHQSVHIKERNHQCEYCGRFFSRKDTLGR